MTMSPPDLTDLFRARQAVEPRVVRTPLLRRDWAGREVWLKAEVLQRTGSFKIRGALNFISRLEPELRAAGVVAYSSGNHAQGVAAAAADFGIPATIVMPSDAPAIKLRNTRRLGATVVEYERTDGNREEIAAEIAAESGATILPPYDHPWTIAGQGTVGLEIAEQVEDLEVDAPLVLVPASGGGLAAGIALAAEAGIPGAKVMTAEPAEYDDHRRSFLAGERVEISPQSTTICDALMQRTPGEITFAVNSRLVAGGVVATDDQVLAAMKWAFEEAKLVVEPGGAVALAALLAGEVPGTGPVVAVLSGGNVDPAVLKTALDS